MNNDLISRSELKEKFIERLDEGFFVYSEIMSIIDNAPTVEDRYSEGYSDGYLDGMSGADMRI